MTASTTPLGPGTLKLGETATALDVSCQLTAAQVEWDKDKEDDETTLCGDVVPGDTTYTATLSGTLYQDLAVATGVVAYTWENKGQAVPFEFVPNTAAGATVTGTVVVDPITVGGDEMKAKMTSDFEWDCVGEPDITFGGAAMMAEPDAEVLEPA
ncbi:MAG TPA: hypothetical protein VKB57_16495 [Acidimicrobiales bacterium]|nr:hypothetical protein [Acidimicrobiales bacterium]